MPAERDHRHTRFVDRPRFKGTCYRAANWHRLGESVSRGYLRKVIEKASAALDAPYGELLDRLPLEQALNVDETGHKDNGGKFWTWVFRAARLAEEPRLLP